MNRTARLAHADQLHAELRDARTYDGHAAECDALDPCESCKAKAAEVRKAQRGDTGPAVPAPRKPSDLQRRLAVARLP